MVIRLKKDRKSLRSFRRLFLIGSRFNAWLIKSQKVQMLPRNNVARYTRQKLWVRFKEPSYRRRLYWRIHNFLFRRFKTIRIKKRFKTIKSRRRKQLRRLRRRRRRVVKSIVRLRKLVYRKLRRNISTSRKYARFGRKKVFIAFSSVSNQKLAVAARLTKLLTSRLKGGCFNSIRGVGFYRICLILSNLNRTRKNSTRFNRSSNKLSQKFTLSDPAVKKRTRGAIKLFCRAMKNLRLKDRWYLRRRRRLRSYRFRELRFRLVKLKKAMPNGRIKQTSCIIYRYRLIPNTFTALHIFTARQRVTKKLGKFTKQQVLKVKANKLKRVRFLLSKLQIPVNYNKFFISLNIFKLARFRRYLHKIMRYSFELIRFRFFINTNHYRLQKFASKRYWLRGFNRIFLSSYRSQSVPFFKSTGVARRLRSKSPKSPLFQRSANIDNNVAVRHLRQIARFNRRWNLHKFFRLVLRFAYLKQRLLRKGKVFRRPVRRVVKIAGSNRSEDFLLLCRLPRILTSAGKKGLSLHIFINLLSLLKFKYKSKFIFTYLLSLDRIRPVLSYKQICTGGKKYNIPVLMPISKSFIIAIRWLISNTYNTSEGLPLALFNNLNNSLKNEGNIVKQRREHHMLAFENKSYTYLLKKLKSGF